MIGDRASGRCGSGRGIRGVAGKGRAGMNDGIGAGDGGAPPCAAVVESDSTKGEGAARRAGVIRLAPEGADADGWRLACDRFGEVLGRVRARFPRDLHCSAVAAFEEWAEDADRRAEAGTVDASTIRAEYADRLAEAVRRSGEAKAADAELHLVRLIAPEYRKPIDRDRLRNPAAFDAVQAWRPEGDRPGLLCAGDTGRGKTRAVFARLAALHRAEGLAFVALSADTLKQRIIDLAQRGGEDGDEDARRDPGGARPADRFQPREGDTLGAFIRKLQTVPVLFIDDLGQAKVTALYAEKLFALIEHRTREGLPLVVTVQGRPPDVVRKLAGWGAEFADTARCLVRRLCDYCQRVSFGFDAEAGRDDADAA